MNENAWPGPSLIFILFNLKVPSMNEISHFNTVIGAFLYAYNGPICICVLNGGTKSNITLNAQFQFFSQFMIYLA